MSKKNSSLDSPSQENHPNKTPQNTPSVAGKVNDNDAKDVEKITNADKKLQLAQAEADKFRDGMLRALADLENYKKRIQKERAEVRNNTIAEIIGVLLPVLDNFELGIAAAEMHNSGSVVDGFKMIFINFKNLLTTYGLQEINPLGQEFDVKFHDCVRKIEDSDQKPGTIVAVDRKGYLINGKLLRPAMVAVA